MPLPLRKGSVGPPVREVQTLLVDRGFLTDEEVNGIFDQETYRAVRAFQAQNLAHGQAARLRARAEPVTDAAWTNPPRAS